MKPSLKDTCQEYLHFDADGWLQYCDAYCLNCFSEDCPNKPEGLNT